MNNKFMEVMANNKKKVAVVASAVLLAGCIGAGAYAYSEVNTAPQAAKVETTQTTHLGVDKIKEFSNPFVDVKNVNILVNSKGIDFKKLVKVPEERKDDVKNIKADSSKVDTKKAGSYEVVYEVTVQENADAKATTVEVPATVKVVTESEAKTLVATGKEVIASDNKVVKDEKQLEEAIKANEEAKEEPKAEETKEEQKEEVKVENKNEAANTGNGGQATGNSNSGNQTASKPAGHTHNWVAQYQTVTDYQNQPVYENQPIYETRPVYGTEYHYICNCGTDCGRDMSAHLASGCFQSYSVKAVTVQTGTETVQVGSQQVQVGTQQVAVGSHQECVGYACSCGATK